MIREQHTDGSTTITETFTVNKRKTYPQNWKAYNAAQTHEQDKFQILLYELCKGVVTPTSTKPGRPPLPLSDAVFNTTFKVYSTMSARRSMSDIRETYNRGFISRIPHYNSILGYLEQPELTPILRCLIHQSILPLKTVEVEFAVDSSGFSTSRFVRWFDVKYGTPRQEHEW